MHKYVYTLVVLLFCAQQYEAQRIPILLPVCVSFDVDQAPGSGELCAPYLSNQIFLPIPGIISEIDKEINKTQLAEIKAAEPVMPTACFDGLLALLCNAAFPPCMVIDGLPSANYSCRVTCEAINRDCLNFYEFFSIDALNCSMPDFTTGDDLFPEEHHVNTNFQKSVFVNTTCIPSDRLPRFVGSRALKPCPYPLGRVPSPIDPQIPPCNAPCPDFVWTVQQYRTLGTIEFSFAFISFCLMLFLSTHYILDPKCRNSTKRFQLYAFLSQAGFAFSFVVAGPDPLHNTWCDSGTGFATWENNARCGTQAFFFVVFGLSAAIYWAISAGIMYFTLQNPKFVLKPKYEACSHLAGIGIPLALLSVAIHKKIITFYWITPLCFIQTQITKGENGLNYQYALFYIPMCVPILVAIVFVGATMFKIFQHMRSMKETFKAQNVTGASIVQVNIRLFIWCASLFLFFTTIVVYRAGVESMWRGLESDATDWGTCKAMAEMGLASDEKCPEEQFPRPLSYAGTVIHYIIATSIGTFSFLSFGTSTNIYIFWYFMIQSIREKKWDQLRSLVTNPKTFAALRNSLATRSSQNLANSPSENIGLQHNNSNIYNNNTSSTIELSERPGSSLQHSSSDSI